MTDQPARRLGNPFDAGDPRHDIWAQTVARLTAHGQVFKADPDVLTAYVEQVHTNRRATTLLGQTDVLIIRDGRAVPNPAVEVQRRSGAAIAALARQLGLGRTPITSALADSPIAADEARWCEDHNRPECKRRRQDGGWCHQWRLIPGLGECRKHGGMKLDELRAKGQVNLARRYGARADVTPVAALLDEVSWSAGHVRSLREALGELEAEPGPDGKPGSGLWWGTTRTITRDGEVVERTEEAKPNVLLTAYNAERAHLARVAHAAITAGAQQEAVDVAKALGAGFGRIIDAIMARMWAIPGELEQATGAELVAWQRRSVPVFVPAVLREYDMGDAG